jgi:hypothetical protein
LFTGMVARTAAFSVTLSDASAVTAVTLGFTRPITRIRHMHLFVSRQGDRV